MNTLYINIFPNELKILYLAKTFSVLYSSDKLVPLGTGSFEEMLP